MGVQNRGFPIHFQTALTTVFRTTVLHYDVAQCRPKGEFEARESTGLLASAVLTPLPGKLGARNILGNWAAQIVTFEGAFSRVPWTL